MKTPSFSQVAGVASLLATLIYEVLQILLYITLGVWLIKDEGSGSVTNSRR